MASKFGRLTEQQIRKAQLEGKLDDLEGSGKPLTERPGDALIDPGDAAGFRIMAEAGALPEEIKLKKQIDATRKAWQAATSPEAKAELMRQLADLELKYEIAQNARRKFLER